MRSHKTPASAGWLLSRHAAWRASWRPLLAASLLCTAATGCAARTKSAVVSPPGIVVPAQLDPAGFKAALYAYRRLEVKDPQRRALRERLVRHLLTQAEQAHVADEYDAAVEKLAIIAGLYAPEELEGGLVPEMAPLLSYLRKQGEKRGDEGRVLAALWYQQRLTPDDATAKEQYALLSAFSTEARANLPAGERYHGLIDVVKEQARLAPAPATLAALADLYTEQRARLFAALRPNREDGSAAPEISFQEYREATTVFTHAPFDIAGVYLVHGDFVRAAERLARLEPITRLEPRVLSLVQAVAQSRPEAKDTLMALSLEYDEQDAREVARALCSYGLRTFPQDARFPRCLGHLAARDDDYTGATREYAAAISLSPDDRSLYDEALQVFAALMRGEVFESDPTETRALADEARLLLAERVRRFPEVPPNVSAEELELLEGVAEMSAGNSDDAEAHLKASLSVRETTRALLQLAQLEARIGKPEQALVHLRSALDKTSRRDLDQLRQRAQIVEQIGDAERQLHRTNESRTSYAEALSLWDASVRPGDDGMQRAFGSIRRGILLSRLGREAESLDAFEQAMQAAPDNREAYGQILAYWVVAGGRPELAAGVLKRAERELTLEAEWRVYFGLWVQAIAARSGLPTPPEVQHQLERLARSDAWWGHLAQLGAGVIDHAALTRLGASKGERTEADFYEGIRRLAARDIAGARALFTRVLDARMVGFYEHQMAQDLMLLSDSELLAAPAAVPTAAAAPVVAPAADVPATKAPAAKAPAVKPPAAKAPAVKAPARPAVKQP